MRFDTETASLREDFLALRYLSNGSESGVFEMMWKTAKAPARKEVRCSTRCGSPGRSEPDDSRSTYRHSSRAFLDCGGQRRYGDLGLVCSEETFTLNDPPRSFAKSVG
jgi:hypothetical protein